MNASDGDVHTKIVGSYMVFQADTPEQVWDSLKKDAFYASGEVVSARTKAREKIVQLALMAHIIRKHSGIIRRRR